jgi:hypothetical protein
LEEDVPQRVAPAVFGTPQRREFPGEQTVRFLLWRYSKYAEHHVYSNIVFAHFPVVMVRVGSLLIYLSKNPPNRILVPLEQKLLCGKSSSICKSRAKVHPDGHHFEIIRV